MRLQVVCCVGEESVLYVPTRGTSDRNRRWCGMVSCMCSSAVRLSASVCWSSWGKPWSWLSSFCARSLCWLYDSTWNAGHDSSDGSIDCRQQLLPVDELRLCVVHTWLLSLGFHSSYDVREENLKWQFDWFHKSLQISPCSSSFTDSLSLRLKRSVSSCNILVFLLNLLINNHCKSESISSYSLAVRNLPVDRTSYACIVDVTDSELPNIEAKCVELSIGKIAASLYGFCCLGALPGSLMRRRRKRMRIRVEIPKVEQTTALPLPGTMRT